MEMAKLAEAAGMRGFVIKMHYDQTADDAYLVRKQFPKLEVFGGIGTNFATGGLNPAAIRQMADVKGGWGRVIWMPTWDAKHYVEHNGQQPAFHHRGEEWPARAGSESRDRDHRRAQRQDARQQGRTGDGHRPQRTEEVLLMVKEARALGVQVLVTHPLLESVA